MTDQDNNNKVNVGVRETVRILIALVLCAGIAYKQGVAKGESSPLRGQYDRVLTEYAVSKARCAETSTEYAALKVQYDRIEASHEYTRCAKASTDYAALKAQYDRIEAQRIRPNLNEPKKRP